MSKARSQASATGSVADAPWASIPEPWLWLGLLGLLFLSFGDALLRPNEPIYLIGPLRALDPSVLQHDWSVGGDPYASMLVPFRLLMAPLWLLSSDPLHVALMARVLLWLWVIAGYRSLARAFDLPAWAWALGLAAYIATARGLTAGEWIFGGAEQKVASYGAVLFAVGAMARGRPVAAGAWIAVATAFHIVVGGWSAIALAAAGLADLRRLRFGRLVVAGVVALVVASPVVVLGLQYLTTPVAAGTAQLADVDAGRSEILALVTNPYHCDPAYFFNFRTIPEVPLVFAAVIWLVWHTAPSSNRRVLVTFVGTICAIFVVGIIARVFHAYGLLTLYPFRVADSLAPAFFWLCVPTTLQGAIRLRRNGGRQPDRVTVAVLVIALLFFAVEVRHLVRNSYRTIVSWLPTTRAERADHLAIYDEIRARLPEDAVIAAAPCESLEWLYGRRALVASYKSTPSNDRIVAWAERMQALDGDRPIEPFTRQRCEAASREFSALTLSQYALLRDRFGATHALLDFSREDLAEIEVVERNGRSLLSLEAIDNLPDARRPDAGIGRREPRPEPAGPTAPTSPRPVPRPRATSERAS